MPRYLVKRTFTDGLHIPIDVAGAKTCTAVVATNREHEVTWLHSFVTTDNHKSYCLYDAPGPEAIRQSAARNKLPVDHITEVRVLDPYFYMG